VETGSISSSGPLAQQMLLEAARTKMLKNQIDAQGREVLKLIQAVTTANSSAGVGGRLNITA